MDLILDFINAMIRMTTPIALGTLACAISERAGVINIGIEGIMAASAVAGGLGAYFSNSPWVGLVSGMAMGALLSGLIVILSIYCNGNQVIIGIGLNLLGPGLAYLLMSEIWGGRGSSPWLPGFPPVNIPIIKDIPVLSNIVSGYDPTVYICIAAVIVMHYMFYHTTWGLRLRASGEDPLVVTTVGINVYKLRTIAVLISGALAGLAGVNLALGSSSLITHGFTANRGFLAYAANRLGQWTPIGAYAASLVFGGMDALRVRLSGTGIAPQLLQMIPYVAAMLTLVITGKRLRGPAASGAEFPHPIGVQRPRKKTTLKVRLGKGGMQDVA